MLCHHGGIGAASYVFGWICAKAGRAAILGLIVGLGIGGAVGFDLGEYDAVVIWCEAFKQFITAARLEN